MTDTILTDNSNLLQTTKFKLVFSRLPNVEYFLTDVNLPGISLPMNNVTTPFRDMPLPGDKLEWEQLQLVFNIDEKMTNWREIYNWMRGLGKPTKYQEYANLKSKSSVYSDASLIITSSQNNASIRVNFVDCWPNAISPIRFTTTGSANEPLICSASFFYLHYDIEIL